MPRKKRSRARNDRWAPKAGRLVFQILGLLSVLCGIYAGFLAAELYAEVRSLLDRSAVQIYSAPLDIWVGDSLSQSRIAGHLHALNYKEVKRTVRPGQYNLSGDRWSIHSREHEGISGRNPDILIDLSVRDGHVNGISAAGRDVRMVSLDPVLLATFSRDDRGFRIPLKREDIPSQVIQAFVAAEDRTFFSHHGVSIRSILRALWVDVTEGEYRQGGSTITQQLAKTVFLSREKTLQRKIKEAVIAIYLDARFSKDEILTLYLNEVYLGQAGASPVVGVGAAARHYFGTGIGSLTLDQAALLSAVAKGPSYYNPSRHPDRALDRRNYVLDAMASAHFIKEEDAARARLRPLGVGEEQGMSSQAGYFLDNLMSRLAGGSAEAKDAAKANMLFTSLEPSLQTAAEEAIREGLARIRRGKPQKDDIEAALVAIRPATGNIAAMVGGEDFQKTPYNRATEALRQAGSTFKPFVYAAALETLSGFNGLSPLEDSPIEFPDGKGGFWSPRNYPEGYRGRLAARDALAFSVNVPSVALGVLVGLDRVAKTAERLGFRKPVRPLPSMPLGALETSPLELATAFLPFAQDGYAVVPRALTHRTDRKGNRVPFKSEGARVRVIEAATAYQITEMLQRVISYGTGKDVNRYGITSELAGKTGTTNDLRDAWFVGYSPDLLAVVWVGRDSGKPLGYTGAGAALPIWARFMSRATTDHPDARFPIPPSVVFSSVCTETGKLAALWCPAERIPLRKGSISETCDVHSSPLDSIRRLWQRMKDR